MNPLQTSIHRPHLGRQPRLVAWLFAVLACCLGSAAIQAQDLTVLTGETRVITTPETFPQVTLEPGSTLRIEGNGRLTAATLNSAGTPESRVKIEIFVSRAESFFFTTGAIYLSRNSETSSIEHTDIEFRGGIAVGAESPLAISDTHFYTTTGASTNATFVAGVFTAARLTVDRSQFGPFEMTSSSASPLSVYGVVADRGNARPTIRATVFRDLRGENGNDGTNGGTGSQGADAPDAIVGNGITGSTGGAGGNGQSGQDGGNTVAILAQRAGSLDIINCIFKFVQGGEGGNGGNGGRGGRGGQGGDGANGVFGDGARGGNGGSGGTGGNGGNAGSGGETHAIQFFGVSNTPNVVNNTAYGIISAQPGFRGIAGTGGAGGPGGAGGSAGIGGSAGASGSTGSPGSPGTNGFNGTDGTAWFADSQPVDAGGSSVFANFTNNIVYFLGDGLRIAFQSISTSSRIFANRNIIFEATTDRSGTARFGGNPSIVADPLLTDPNNGDFSDYTPLPGSPAIDAGSRTFFPASIQTDFLGNARFADDLGTVNTGIGTNSSDTFIIDIGAIEAPGLIPSCLADTNNDGLLDNGDIGTFVGLFLAGDPAADLNSDGFLDLGDIGTFVAAFLAGC